MRERIWARVSRKQKISIPVLLSGMGLNLEEILDNTRYPERFLFFIEEGEVGAGGISMVEGKSHSGVL